MFLIAAALMVLVALLPVKIAASLVGARNSAWKACLIAVVVAVAVHLVLHHFVRYGSVVAALLTGAVYMVLLETSYLKGVLIALLQGVLAWLLGLVLAMLGLAAMAHLIGPSLAPAAGAHWI